MKILRGFTLIELMIALVILGILVSLALPAYTKFTVRASAAEAMNLVSNLQEEVMEYYQTYTVMPSDPDLVRAPADTQGINVSSVTVTGGSIEVQYGNDAPAAIMGMTIGFHPYTSPDLSVSWQCGTHAMPAALTFAGGAAATTLDPVYRPASCK